MACKVSDVDDGGYDVMFIEEPPEFLLCIVCHLALRKPIQIIDCGHRFCRTCFDKMKRSSNERGTDLLCPLDRHVIDTSKVFPDKGYERLVMELKVNCDNQGKGCQWKGDLCSLEPHLNINCLYEFVSCEREGCEEKSERRLLDGHMTNCSKRVVVAADNLKLIEVLTKRLQGLQESQVEIKEQLKQTKDELKQTKDELKQTKDELRETEDELKETKDELKETKDGLRETEDELNVTKEEMNVTKEELKQKNGEMKIFHERLVRLENNFKQQMQVLQKEVEQMQTNEKGIVKLPNDSACKKCKDKIVQNRDNFSSPSNKPNIQILSEKIGEEVIQVKLGEWFTWKSNVPHYDVNYLYSPSYLTDDGYHFKIRFGYNWLDDYYYLCLRVFKDEIKLKRGSFMKTISSQIGDIKNSTEVHMTIQQNDYFNKSSWRGYPLSDWINKRYISKNMINNYISIQLMIE